MQGLTAGWEKRANANLRGLVEKGKLAQKKGHYRVAAAAKKAAVKKPVVRKPAAKQVKPEKTT